MPPQKKAPQMDIMMAFATARAGTKCSICNKRVSHAVYQRHIEKCKIPEDDDDIVFLQEIPGNQIPANRKSRNCMKKEISSQCKSILSKTTSSVKRGQACLIQAHSANSNLVLPTLHNGSEGALSHSLSDENMNVRPGPYNRDDADQLIISHSVSSKRDSVLQTRKSISSADQTQYNISNDNEVNVSIPLSPSSAHDHTDAPNIDGRSKRISDSSIESRRKKSRLSDQNEVEDDQCEIHPQELYRICIDKIKEWFSKHKWITVSSLEQSSQVQRHIQSQRSQTPLSSSIDNFQSQRPSSAGNRIHYSLRFFWEIVLDVLSNHSEDKITQIWGLDLRSITRLLSCSRFIFEAQQLLIRLCVRRLDWHCPSKLSYNEIAENLVPCFEELADNRLAERAFSSERITVSEALNRLDVKQLVELTKFLKLDNKIGIKNDDMKKSIEDFSRTKSYFVETSNSKLVLDRIRSRLGEECYRISTNFLDLFNSFLTVYSPFFMDPIHLYDDISIHLGSHLMFALLQIKKKELSFVSSEMPHRYSLLDIYANRDQFLKYLRAKQLEEKMKRNIDSKNYEGILGCIDNLKTALVEELSTMLPTYTLLSLHQRQYTAPWIFLRCLTIGVDAAEKSRYYQKAVDLLTYLTSDDNVWHFCPNARWRWHTRLALNLDSHLKNYQQAFEVCLSGFHDESIGPAHKLNLQDRAIKLAKRLKKSFISQIITKEIEKVEISGKVIAKNLGDGRVNRFYLTSSDNEIGHCSVEDIALSFFLKNDYKEGYHSEGGVWHTLFRLFFYDIIYANDVPSVWNSKMQDDPCDLNLRTFYTNRKERFDERLETIRLSSISELKEWVASNYQIARSYGWSKSRIGWHKFDDGLPELQRFVACCTSDLLHELFKRLIIDFKNTRSGFPDLTLWNVETKKLLVAEVKGPNDKLSSKQILWLNFFADNGVRAIVCHVKAQNGKALQ